MKRNAPAKGKIQKGILGRVIKSVFRFYPKMLTVAFFLIVVKAIVSSRPSNFIKRILSVLEGGGLSGGWAV